MTQSAPAAGARPSLKIELFTDYAEVSDGRGINKKTITHESLATELLRALPTVEARGRARRVPFGTLFTEDTTGGMFMAVYYPGDRKRPYRLNYNGEHTFNVVIPNVVLEVALVFNGNKLAFENYGLYSTNLAPDILGSRYAKGWRCRVGQSRHSAAGGCFDLPFTNMHDRGVMCLGGNSAPPVMSPEDLTPVNRYYEILVDAPGNSDLGIRGIRRGSMSEALGEGLIHYFKHWETLESFPYDNLVEI